MGPEAWRMLQCEAPVKVQPQEKIRLHIGSSVANVTASTAPNTTTNRRTGRFIANSLSDAVKFRHWPIR